MVGSSAPLVRRRNGRNVRNAVRMALSMMPIDSSTGNPRRSGFPNTRAPARDCGVLAGDAKRGKSRKMAPDAAIPIPPSSPNVTRQGKNTMSSVAAAGTSILPTSPEKL